MQGVCAKASYGWGDRNGEVVRRKEVQPSRRGSAEKGDLDPFARREDTSSPISDRAFRDNGDGPEGALSHPGEEGRGKSIWLKTICHGIIFLLVLMYSSCNKISPGKPSASRLPTAEKNAKSASLSFELTLFRSCHFVCSHTSITRIHRSLAKNTQLIPWMPAKTTDSLDRLQRSRMLMNQRPAKLHAWT